MIYKFIIITNGTYLKLAITNTTLAAARIHVTNTYPGAEIYLDIKNF
jgi:hypothetical protein